MNNTNTQFNNDSINKLKELLYSDDPVIKFVKPDNGIESSICIAKYIANRMKYENNYNLFLYGPKYETLLIIFEHLEKSGIIVEIVDDSDSFAYFEANSNRIILDGRVYNADLLFKKDNAIIEIFALDSSEKDIEKYLKNLAVNNARIFIEYNTNFEDSDLSENGTNNE